jgi:hypothetical protein
MPSFSPVVLASVLSTVVSRAYFGNHPPSSFSRTAHECGAFASSATSMLSVSYEQPRPA